MRCYLQRMTTLFPNVRVFSQAMLIPMTTMRRQRLYPTSLKDYIELKNDEMAHKEARVKKISKKDKWKFASAAALERSDRAIVASMHRIKESCQAGTRRKRARNMARKVERKAYLRECFGE